MPIYIFAGAVLILDIFRSVAFLTSRIRLSFIVFTLFTYSRWAPILICAVVDKYKDGSTSYTTINTIYYETGIYVYK
uniref:Putative product n=1 Tax=Xenopsylla cheopis TaxID=163159 RepID=A0A6M2DUT9_XENCH